jgi:hypothetical protein
MKQVNHFLVIVLCLLSLSASAQWAWIDKDGKKVFSDRAPDAEVPVKNVFKQPGKTFNQLPMVTSPVSANPTTEQKAEESKPASAKPLAGVDKELAERMKKAEQEQAAKKKAEEERISKLRAENCQRAKMAQKNLDSGARLSRINAQGEREVLDDAARSLETKRLQGIVQIECQ